MDYGQIYADLIERALTRTLSDDVYVEKHHVWPKCMGGPDEKSNLVTLTWPEHRLAHMLLVKMFPNNNKLVFACGAMTMDAQGNRINRKMSEWLKKKYSEARSIANRNMSKETRQKISEYRKGKSSWNKGKSHSDKTRRKMSENRRGKVAKNKGKPMSEEQKRKISETKKANKLLKLQNLTS
jgi:hypothetical protein